MLRRDKTAFFNWCVTKNFQVCGKNFRESKKRQNLEINEKGSEAQSKKYFKNYENYINYGYFPFGDTSRHKYHSIFVTPLNAKDRMTFVDCVTKRKAFYIVCVCEMCAYILLLF